MFKRRKPDDLPDPAPAAPRDPSADKLEVGMPSPSPFNQSRPAAPAPGAASPRPVTKETAPMGRTPYATPPQPTPQGASPGASLGTGPATSSNPMMVPGSPRPGLQPPRQPAAATERRTLVVGRGISVQGTVQDAERLVVEGTVEASMIRATELSIAEGGVFKGAVEVEEAEIAGTIDGTLTARGNLIVRTTGKVLGTANYRRLQVEDGGQITGELKMMADTGARSEAKPASDAA